MGVSEFLLIFLVVLFYHKDVTFHFNIVKCGVSGTVPVVTTNVWVGSPDF